MFTNRHIICETPATYRCKPYSPTTQEAYSRDIEPKLDIARPKEYPYRQAGGHKRDEHKRQEDVLRLTGQGRKGHKDEFGKNGRDVHKAEVDESKEDVACLVEDTARGSSV